MVTWLHYTNYYTSHASHSMQESLVSFIEQRYQVACVVPLTIHSFITALTEHHTQHKVSKNVSVAKICYISHFMQWLAIPVLRVSWQIQYYGTSYLWFYYCLFYTHVGASCVESHAEWWIGWVWLEAASPIGWFGGHDAVELTQWIHPFCLHPLSFLTGNLAHHATLHS